MTEETANSGVDTGQAEVTQTSNTEAPETTTEQTTAEPQLDYEHQYKNLQADYTKKAQKLAEYERREKEQAVSQLAESGQEEPLPDFLKGAPKENIEAFNTLRASVVRSALQATQPVYIDNAVTWAKANLKDFDETDQRLIDTVKKLGGAKLSQDPLSDMKMKLEWAYKINMADKYKQVGADEARALDKAKANSASLERGGTTAQTKEPKLAREDALRKAIRDKFSK